MRRSLFLILALALPVGCRGQQLPVTPMEEQMAMDLVESTVVPSSVLARGTPFADAATAEAVLASGDWVSLGFCSWGEPVGLNDVIRALGAEEAGVPIQYVDSLTVIVGGYTVSLDPSLLPTVFATHNTDLEGAAIMTNYLRQCLGTDGTGVLEVPEGSVPMGSWTLTPHGVWLWTSPSAPRFPEQQA